MAPVDGIVIKGDLTQSLGAPVELGDTLLEIAPSSGYKVYLLIPESDIHHVEIGQTGRLTLRSNPGNNIPIIVTNIHPVAVGQNGINHFRIEANFNLDGESIRPGQTGIAKLTGGDTNLLWSLSNRLVTWVRLRIWEWIG